MVQTETSGQGETFVVNDEDEEMSSPPPREASSASAGKFQTFTLDDLPPSKW